MRVINPHNRWKWNSFYVIPICSRITSAGAESSSEGRKKMVALSNCVMHDRCARAAAFHGSERTRRSDDARDNFSASSHLIYGVPVMEETCGDSRISSIESSGRKWPGWPTTEERFHSGDPMLWQLWLFSVPSTSLRFPPFSPGHLLFARFGFRASSGRITASQITPSLALELRKLFEPWSNEMNLKG